MISEYYNNKLTVAKTEVIVQHKTFNREYLTRHCCRASFDYGIMRCPFCSSKISKDGNCQCFL